MLTWGGLRGGLSMALALPGDVPHRELLATMTLGGDVLSILRQGLSRGLLLRWLGLTEARTDRRDYARQRGLVRAKTAALAALDKRRQDGAVPADAAVAVRDEHARGHRRRGAAPQSARQIIALQLAVQGPTIKTQALRRQRLVAADNLQDTQNVAPLDFIHGEKLAWMVARDDHLRRKRTAKPQPLSPSSTSSHMPRLSSTTRIFGFMVLLPLRGPWRVSGANRG